MKIKVLLKLVILFILIASISFLGLDIKFKLQNGEFKNENNTSKIIPKDEDFDCDKESYKDEKIETIIDNKVDASLGKDVQPKINDIKPPNLGNHNLSNSKIIDRELNEEKDILNKDINGKYNLKIAIRAALRDFKDLLSLNVYNVSKDDYGNAITEVLREYAELDYGYSSSSCEFTSYGDGRVCINYKFIYNADRNTLITKRDKVNNKVKDIINKNTKSNMSKLQKELIFHDYLVDNAEYNKYYVDKGIVHPDDHTAYGALIEKKGVCESYAKAFNLLCKSGDIESIVVSGSAGGPHAWNMVKLDDNNWYNVDVTWDDPVMEDKSATLVKTNHTYFNISTSEINKNHKINHGYPKANGTKYLRDNIDIKEYDGAGNLFINVSNLNELKALVKTQLTKKNANITCKLKGFTIDQNSIFNVVTNVAGENSITIKGMNLTSDGALNRYFRVTIKY